jgi:hypothetical protein
MFTKTLPKNLTFSRNHFLGRLVTDVFRVGNTGLRHIGRTIQHRNQLPFISHHQNCMFTKTLPKNLTFSRNHFLGRLVIDLCRVGKKGLRHNGRMIQHRTQLKFISHQQNLCSPKHFPKICHFPEITSWGAW